jgi:hypothetical protein
MLEKGQSTKPQKEARGMRCFWEGIVSSLDVVQKKRKTRLPEITRAQTRGFSERSSTLE